MNSSKTEKIFISDPYTLRTLGEQALNLRQSKVITHDSLTRAGAWHEILSLVLVVLELMCAQAVASYESAPAAYYWLAVCVAIALGFVWQKRGAVRGFIAGLMLALFAAGTGYGLIVGSFPSLLEISELDALYKAQSEGKGQRTSYRYARVTLSGTVSSRPVRPRPGEIRFSFAPLAAQKLSGKILVSGPDLPWNELSGIKKGDVLSTNIRVRLLAGPERTIPSPFSYNGYLFRRGFVATARIKTASLLGEDKKGASSREGFLERLIRRNGSSEALSVILAVTLGERSLVGKEIKELFKRTGTSHLLVVSGFHIGLVYVLLFAISRFLATRFEGLLLLVSAQAIAALVALLGACAYAAVVGGSMTAIRALLVLAVFSVGSILDRRADALRTIVLAFLSVIIIWPGAFFEAGCQLTFSALLGLVVAIRVMGRRRRQGVFGRVIDYTMKTLVCSFFAWAYTLPVVLCWFEGFAPAAAFVNTLAIPFFCFGVIAFGEVSVVVFFVSEAAGEVLLGVNVWMVEVFLEVLSGIDGLLDGTFMGFRMLESGTAKSVAGYIGGLNVLVWSKWGTCWKFGV